MLFELLTWKDELEFGVLLLVVISAWRWGAGPEKACAGALLYMALVDYPYHWILGRSAILGTVDVGHAFIDFSTAAIFIYVALKANRLYPLWLAALQSISILSHLGRDLNREIDGLAYGILIIAPSYLEIAILSVGVYMHHSRVKKHGKYRSWRTFSDPSPTNDLHI